MSKYHFIGMCGKAMGTLAVMLKSQGHTVTGSDEGFYDPMLSYLKQHGVSFTTGHSAENIPEDVDYIVIGKHAKLVPETNPEVAKAFTTPEKVMSLPDVMKNLTQNKDNIICVGSFGKSTVTTLTSFILEHAGKNPSYFIGAVPIDLNDSGKLTNSNIFVLEGDEYPSSNWDESAKFMHYNPNSIILTSCEHDHINVYPTLESYLKPFQDLASILPENGLIVYAVKGAHIQEKVLSYAKNATLVSYGLNIGDYSSDNIEYGDVTSFDLVKGGQTLVKIETNLLGQHNIENIIGVSGMLLEKNLVTTEELYNAVKNFHGVKGRLDRKISNSDIPIFESFGSSYAKAKADISAVKLHFPNKKIISIFEPHTFGWRNRLNLEWYNTVFEGCDSVYIFQPPTHGASTIDQLTQDEIVNAVKGSGIANVIAVSSKEDVYNQLKNDLTSDSLIMLTTSGNLDGLPEDLPNKINTF
jgi:UDP-N-acetylmuramate: L-alanyl-gamma-D-glutamyl-meso-diaminopimelate ligase